MTDWKLKARALGLTIPDDQLEKTVAPLAALEPMFEKLASRLKPEVEPAAIFDPAPQEPE